MNGISRETFDGMSDDSKLGTLFDYIHEIHIKIQDLEKRRVLNTTASGLGGFLGGIVAVWAWVKWATGIGG
jgi:hypothetical protein